MINIGAEDYNVLKQQYIKKYIRLELLDFQYNIVDELSGNMTKCSINVDSNSDLRRSCDLGFVVTTSTFDIKSGSKLWLDKFVRPFVGYENMRTGEIQWYNQGIYLVNNPQWSYDASTNEISMQALDLMSKLTGLRNGNLEGIPTVIAKDENVREAIISTLALGGFTKYVCEECKTNDGTIVPVPYDIEIDVGGTIYDILAELRDIMPNYQIYFDVNGVFHYEPIPLAYDDPVLIDDDLWPSLLISENINTDFESVKNYVEVLGHTWDVDYYSPSESTTVSGGTITPTFADLKELQNDTAVGITLPSDITITPSILPEGYTQIEYIEASGTQYIDTGFKPNQNTKFEVDMDITNTGCPVFGARTAYLNKAFVLFWASNSGFCIQMADSNFNGGTFTTTGRHKVTMTSSQLVIDDNLQVSYSVGNFQCEQNAWLMSCYSSSSSEYAKGKLYSAKIYNGNTLVRNFIPCKNPSGTVGMYDLVNSQFYGNSGSGSFIAGSELPTSNKIVIDYLGTCDVLDINDEPVKELTKDTEWIFQAVATVGQSQLPTGYTQLEYISVSGAQYIDTGIKPNQNYAIKIKVQTTNVNNNTFAGCDTDWQNTGFFVGANVFSFGNFSTTSVQNYGESPIELFMDKTGGYKDGEKIWTISGSATFQTINNLTLFVLTRSGQRREYLTGKFYYCLITENEVPVREFIPCKNSDGVVGLYETVEGQFYQNAGTGEFTAGEEWQPGQEMKFWRFMGHQQAQALSYDNNPSSPFYVGNPIGSSSVGRIRIVLYGGEYDNIYSDDLAQQRADFEIYQRSRLNDSISMETIPIPWMDANIVISHRFGQKQEPSKYIVKSFSVDYATVGTMTINAITWYPYYKESEVV